MKIQKRRSGSLPLLLLFALVCTSEVAAKSANDRQRLKLLGPVMELEERQQEGQKSVFVVSRRFDQNGNEVEVVSGAESEGRLVSGVKTTMRYDRQGHKVKEIARWIDGAPNQTRLYAHDASGNKVAEATYSATGSFDSVWVYHYDRYANPVEQVRYSSKEPFFRKISKNFYDENGGLMHAEIVEHSGERTEEQYGTSGLVVESQRYKPEGPLESRSIIRYDSQGKELESEIYDHTGKLISKMSNTYESDRFGNWTKRIFKVVVKSGNPSEEVLTVSRRIRYYDGH